MAPPNPEKDEYAADRRGMLEDIAAHARQCAAETGRSRISDRVLEAMARAPRHRFVPSNVRPFAYADMPLPIGSGKTVSQPFMVALVTDLLDVGENDKALEIGAGLGYQAAVLSELTDQVYTVEILSELGDAAERLLRETGYDKVRVRIGDGSRGWPEEAPFDKILISAGAKKIPGALIDQLRPGGRMVAPTGEDDAQMLRLIDKNADGEICERALIPVRYSPLTVPH